MNEPTIMVWSIVYYTEDEEGNITKYTTKDSYDHSRIAEDVTMDDLVKIEDE